MRDLVITETRCRSLLNRTAGRFADYTVNAYTGCAFGCAYCYVPVLRRRRGQSEAGEWGRWTNVKVNAPDVLRREMLRVDRTASVAIGTASDSWQPLEKQYRISRQILEELSLYPNPVTIMTRSPLLLRDIDVLSRMPSVSIGVSMSSVDESIRRSYEPCAPAIPGRLALLRGLREAGVRASMFLCPVVPGVGDRPGLAFETMRAAAECAVTSVSASPLRYGDVVGARCAELGHCLRRDLDARHGRPIGMAGFRRELAQAAGRYQVEFRTY